MWRERVEGSKRGEKETMKPGMRRERVEARKQGEKETMFQNHISLHRGKFWILRFQVTI